VGWQAAGFILGGVGVLVLLGIIFVIQVNMPARPGHDMMPGMLGGASVLGFGLLARGLFLLRTTARVVVDDSWVHLESAFARRSVGWGEIARIECDKRSPALGGETLRVVRLIGTSGKRLAEISETIGDFEFLANEITQRSTAARGQATFDAQADEKRRVTRDAKKIEWVSFFFGLATLGMGATLWAGINEEMHLRRYASEGKRVEAKIVRRYMYRVTPRLEFSFRDEAGKEHTRDTMMYQGPAWDALEGKKTVPVEYLKSDPSWNRLLEGEDAETKFGGKFLLVSGGGFLVFGFLFLVTLLGFDLKMENGVNTLTRRGVVVKQWGTARK
jgi:hypothetical protein